MANAANAQTGSFNTGASVSQPLPAVKPSPGTPGMEFEAPEGAAKTVAGKTAGATKGAGVAKATVLPAKGAAAPALPPPGVELEVPEGIKAAKTVAAKTAVGKGTATRAATGTLVAGKGTAGKSIAASAPLTAGKGILAASPNGIAIKGITAGGSFWSGSVPAVGIGLGSWAPIIIAGAAAALGVGIYSFLKNKKNKINELDDAVS
ncbi:MAG: hypothetical protein HQL84_01985 [Magnetococcales bacterium]|nr:hypothetical protein [Magnetococcales bacterium]MBF0148796.1 hypothetical protein [Magnetococcales bacterium]MBF0173396.1 hypothetical protein [Magnetococcales bacterium]MBF0346479.1 hypothetical protein [Magnetococcales bacterium]MBF0629869.1 hypothetical protein [Magnetococcales bacterium]